MKKQSSNLNKRKILQNNFCFLFKSRMTTYNYYIGEVVTCIQ